MNFVTREQWGARRPTSTPSSINSTVTTGHWEGPNLWGRAIGPHASCAAKVRGIQNYHMDANHWSDIAYNGVACPHGYVFEGRGPQKRSAANGTNAANGQSAVICYLGGEGDEFTAEGQQAMADGAAWLGDPMFKGHRDWYATACPGDTIYGWIQNGAHPAPTPPPPQQSEDEVAMHIVKGDKSPEWWHTDLLTRKVWIPSANAASQIIWCTAVAGSKVSHNPDNGPITIEQALIDKIPDITRTP